MDHNHCDKISLIIASLKKSSLLLKEKIKLSLVLPRSSYSEDCQIIGLYLPRISFVPFTLINVTLLCLLSHNSWNFLGVNPSVFPLNNKSSLYGKYNSLR